jgi:hypothetical protein
MITFETTFPSNAGGPTLSPIVRFKRRIINGLVLCMTLAAIVVVAQKKEWSEQAQLDFLKMHWEVPIPLQGKPPADWSESEASLAPETCGGCHPAQFKDWKTTIHGRAVGPGLLGQTPALLREEPATAKVCYTCHAPLRHHRQS